MSSLWSRVGAAARRCGGGPSFGEVSTAQGSVALEELRHPELKVSTPAHTQHLDRYLEFEFELELRRRGAHVRLFLFGERTLSVHILVGVNVGSGLRSLLRRHLHLQESSQTAILYGDNKRVWARRSCAVDTNCPR